VRSIPYAGAAAFARLAARTLVVRVVLWVALAVLIVATAAAARHPHQSAEPFVAPSAGGMVVLDLSASITSDTYSRIHETLQQLVARGGRYGLVVFSSSAYEALPPGTPASALEPLVRYFAVPHAAPGEQPSFPVNPWGAADFTSGTEISLGLDLARQIELANHVRHPAVVLISDLQDDPNDLQRLNAVASEYQIEHIRSTAIALNADPNDVARFQGLFGKAISIIPAGLSSSNGNATVAPPHTSFPTWLVVLTVLVALLLGAAELRSAQLTWGGEPVEVTS
jgi:hypothetical protein